MASAEFEQAVEAVKGLTTDPGNEVKLRLYGLFKQATAGDVTGSRPRLHEPGRARQVRRVGQALGHVDRGGAGAVRRDRPRPDLRLSAGASPRSHASP